VGDSTGTSMFKIICYEELDHLWSILTDMERRRVGYRFCFGLNIKESAKLEGVSAQAISQTLIKAEKKALKVRRHEEQVDFIQRLFVDRFT